MATLKVLMGADLDGVSVGARVQVEATGSSALKIEEAVADEAVDAQITCAIDEDSLAGFFLVSDQDVTVQTNSGSAPQETITLNANVPVFWVTDMGGTKPISDDVTALFVTNDSGATANVRLVVITDATPA